MRQFYVGAGESACGWLLTCGRRHLCRRSRVGLCDNLPRIHDALRIERLLDRAHGGKRRFAQFAREIFHLALPDAVLAGAGAVHGDRPLHQPLAKILRAYDFVGDGNFHLVFLLDPKNPAEFKAAETVNARMVARAIAMDGTCTGEHGIGYGKTEFLIAEHGEAVSVMRAIKRALDPYNIMNPGKILRS